MRKSSRRKKGQSTSFEQEHVEEEVAAIPQEQDRQVPPIPTSSFSINWDSLNTRRKITSDLRDEICDFYYSVQKSPKAQIAKLNEMIEEYSDIQIFYNFLEMAYREEEDFDKANEIARTTAKKFPDLITTFLSLLRGKSESLAGYLPARCASN